MEELRVVLNNYRILLVDDHPIYRAGLAEIINKVENLSVVDQASSTEAALVRYHETKPDLVISDLNFAESSGMALIQKIRALPSHCPILVLSMHEEVFWAEQVLQQGANGYVQKDAEIPDVLAAIQKTAAGEIYLSNEMQQRLLRQITSSGQHNSSLNVLSRREMEIFRYLAQGFKNPDIAEALFISQKTVQAHQSNMKRKLKLNSLSSLRKFAEDFSVTTADD